MGPVTVASPGNPDVADQLVDLHQVGVQRRQRWRTTCSAAIGVVLLGVAGVAGPRSPTHPRDEDQFLAGAVRCVAHVYHLEAVELGHVRSPPDCGTAGSNRSIESHHRSRSTPRRTPAETPRKSPTARRWLPSRPARSLPSAGDPLFPRPGLRAASLRRATRQVEGRIQMTAGLVPVFVADEHLGDIASHHGEVEVRLFGLSARSSPKDRRTRSALVLPRATSNNAAAGSVPPSAKQTASEPVPHPMSTILSPSPRSTCTDPDPSDPRRRRHTRAASGPQRRRQERARDER